MELFFFVMVVHLWGKYWMAAWRGGRTRVWITGAVTFLVAIPCALTGYVSQQNFDAQWISTQAKDGLNSVGVGAFFNVTNFGQMYSYHVLLLPAAVVALVVAHVLLVRRHGVVPPFALEDRAASSGAASAEREPALAVCGAFLPCRWDTVVTRFGRLRSHDDTGPWRGAYAPYDLVKELCVAIGVITLLAILLTELFSSPDDRPSTIAQWSREQPVNFVAAAAKELNGTSDTAEYGPPYNHNGEGQHAAFIYLQKWLGVSHPIDTANDFVIDPLRTIPNDPTLQSAIAQYRAAPEQTQKAWGEAYAKPLEEYETAIEEKKTPPKTVTLDPTTGVGRSRRAAPVPSR